MPQFDFFTAFNQIFYGAVGFFAIYSLFVTSGPFYEKAIRWYRSFYNSYVSRRKTTSDEWRDRIRNGVIPSWWENKSFVRDIPSYLEFFHALFLARKIKLFLINRVLVVVTYFAYLKAVREFVSVSNWVSQSVRMSGTLFALFSQKISNFCLRIRHMVVSLSEYVGFAIYGIIR